ncbi:MAG: hypothetical protein NTV08_11395 [Verrucomicrobia bacterium]|nr:hypothetical protein [Verrucomicrobiota bacterium]
MKRTLIPLFAALIFAGTARSQNPDQPGPDGPALERLKHEVEELRRAGKNEEAEARERKPDGAQEVHREKSKSEPNPEGKPEPKEESRKSPPNPGPARPDAPAQVRKDGPFAGGPIAERLKGRIEALRREGKGEQAEQFAKRAREMWEKRRGGLAGGDRGKSYGDKPAPRSDERAAHLAEAAKHLNAAGIHVSPEMLEKFGQKSSGKPERRPLFSHRLERPAGSPGGFGERRHFPSKDGAAPGTGSRIDAMHRGPDGMPGHHPAPPQANRALGAGPSSDAVQNEIRALAKQVQELRAMIQEQRGGAPDAAPMPQGGGGAFQRPHFRAPQAAPGGPGANRKHSGFPQRNPGESRGDNHPRSEGRPSNPPGNPAIPGDRPRGDAPQP